MAEKICDCNTGKEIDLKEICPTVRAKRAPSKYNLFLSECIKERKKDFKSCVDLWNKEKDTFKPK